MNAPPAPALAAAYRRNRLALSAKGAWRALLRVPLASQVVPIAGAFLCSYLLYQRIAGDGGAPGWGALAGLASFIALFAQLRLIDDLDDLQRDYPAAQYASTWRSARRARLIAALAACMILVTILNHAKWQALMAAAAATALALAAPFGFKRLFPRSLLAGSLVFEGAPFLIFAYCYFFWRDAGGTQLPLLAAVCVAALFWTGYEFWKFSRKIHTDAMQPYFLAHQGIRAALTAFLVLALAANLSLAHFARLSDAYTTYALALPLAWLVWTYVSWPVAPGARSGIRRPLWAGMTFVGALELGLLVELVPSLGVR